jgi:uncharacterized protein YqhQ
MFFFSLFFFIYISGKILIPAKRINVRSLYEDVYFLGSFPNESTANVVEITRKNQQLHTAMIHLVSIKKKFHAFHSKPLRQIFSSTVNNTINCNICSGFFRVLLLSYYISSIAASRSVKKKGGRL